MLKFIEQWVTALLFVGKLQAPLGRMFMHWLSLRNLSLRYVLLLALLVGLMVPSWLAFVYERQEVQERLSKELASDRDRYADLLAVSLREPLWQLAPLFAEPLIDKIMEDPKVSAIVVRRLPEGQIFMEKERKGYSRHVETNATEREIRMQGNTLGTVSVYVNDDGVLDATSAAQQRFLWRTAFISLAAILLIFTTLHWRLTRPIDTLVKQSEALADGHLSEAVLWQRNDEVGRVGRSLEDTRRALAKLVGELRDVNTSLRSENEQRKKAEAEIAQHAEALESRVAERTSELSDANATLSVTLDNLRQTQNDLIESRKLASLGRMVAGVAHELNTPIGNALTVGSTLGQRVRDIQELATSGQLKKSGLTEFLDATLEGSEVLERSLTRAASLVTRFKTLAESDATEKLSTFDLVEVTTVACASIQSSLKGTPIRLINDVPSGIAMTGYPDLMTQVLANLLGNAQVHAFEGLQAGEIRIHAHSRADSVEITVSDNGIGIAPEAESRIFDPMFTTRLGRGGMGLGLSVVHNIVTRQMGGKVQLQHVLPHGACFVLSLPLIAPAPGSDGHA
ncbi:MAG: HAMP domain-containing protein [Rhodoferax sp.]|nr:HAMP domain-containing protein [Rhodoferax sp.]